MKEASWDDFQSIDMRVGTILAVEDFPEARKSAYKLTIDFGEFGIKRSSAQITDLYLTADLVGKQVIAVINFPVKRIAGFASECLVTGVSDADGRVSLVSPDHEVPNGSRLY